MLRVLAYTALLGAGLAPAIGCTCGEADTPPCPAQFKVGDQCQFEGQKCVFPGGMCGATCTCRNEPGAYRWQCATEQCSCRCASCGRAVFASCEELECTRAPNDCPASTAELCELACSLDLSDPDPDGGDGNTDLSGDGTADATGDGNRDGTADGAPDGGADGALDADDASGD